MTYFLKELLIQFRIQFVFGCLVSFGVAFTFCEQLGSAMPCVAFDKIEVALLDSVLVNLLVMVDEKLGNVGAVDFGARFVSLLNKRLREMVLRYEFRNVEVFSYVTHSISHLL